MTELTITPKIETKEARFKGTIAAGEHVAVTIKGGAEWLGDDSGAGLMLRVIDCTTRRTLAVFPRPQETMEEGETPDAWATSADESGEMTDLTCTLNLNSDRMVAAARHLIHVPVLFVLGDTDDPRTLYFRDTYVVEYWPERIGDDAPYCLDKWPKKIDEWTELVGEFEDRVDAAEEEMAALLGVVSGIVTDVAGKKDKQTAKDDPAASGTALSFIDSISQDANGEITATKKNVKVDSVPLGDSPNPVASGGVWAALEGKISEHQQLADRYSAWGFTGQDAPEGYHYAVGEYDDDEMEEWPLLRIRDSDGEMDSVADRVTGSESATTLTFSTAGVTATRTKLMGYQLGDQSTKPLAGLADLFESGGSTIKAALLPSYVDDVLEYAALANFPATGEEGKIYVAKDTNKTYRWSGSVYVQVGGSDITVDSALSDTSTNPVQNRVVKAAVDAKCTVAEAAAEVARLGDWEWTSSKGYIQVPDRSYLPGSDDGNGYFMLSGNPTYISGDALWDVSYMLVVYTWDEENNQWLEYRDEWKSSTGLGPDADTVEFSADVSSFGTFTARRKNAHGLARLADLPTKTSDLTNDSGFLTSHQSLDGLMPKYGFETATVGTGNTLTVSPYTVATCTPTASAAFSVAMGALPTGVTGKARDAVLVIDCSSLSEGDEPTVTWGTHFHPRTDTATDLAIVEAGKRAVFYISEYASGEFAVGGWTETAGGNA